VRHRLHADIARDIFTACDGFLVGSEVAVSEWVLLGVAVVGRRSGGAVVVVFCFLVAGVVIDCQICLYLRGWWYSFKIVRE